MRAICFLLLSFLMVFVPAVGLAFSAQDAVDLKEAGFSDEIISLMMKPTRSVQPKDLIELKKAGVSQEVIKTMILDDLIEQPDNGQIAGRLVTEEIINLKKSGVSDETLQKMLDREERERARYYGVARTIKNPDGSESIVYGNLNAPFPETRHHYIATSEYLKYLSLSLDSDDTLAPAEKALWLGIFNGLRLRKDIN